MCPEVSGQISDPSFFSSIFTISVPSSALAYQFPEGGIRGFLDVSSTNIARRNAKAISEDYSKGCYRNALSRGSANLGGRH